MSDGPGGTVVPLAIFIAVVMLFFAMFVANVPYWYLTYEISPEFWQTYVENEPLWVTPIRTIVFWGLFYGLVMLIVSSRRKRKS